MEEGRKMNKRAVVKNVLWKPGVLSPVWFANNVALIIGAIRGIKISISDEMIDISKWPYSKNVMVMTVGENAAFQMLKTRCRGIFKKAILGGKYHFDVIPLAIVEIENLDGTTTVVLLGTVYKKESY